MDAQPRQRTKEEEFTDAVAPHYAALVRRLTVVVGDLHAGQDLAQETYLRAFRAWSRFDGDRVTTRGTLGDGFSYCGISYTAGEVIEVGPAS